MILRFYTNKESKGMIRIFQFLFTAICIMVLPAFAVANDRGIMSLKLKTLSILTLQSVLKQVEENHPLLKGSQTEKMVASGKLLEALGKFEPTIVNDWELERLAKQSSNKTLGFNDTFVQMRHKSGVKGFAGFRAGIGDVSVTDLAIGSSNQPLMGIAIPLLRGLNTNPDHAKLKKSNLAEEQAKLEIQQTRQELYFGAANQYWNWVAALKFMELENNAVAVAEERLIQLEKQRSAGSIPMFDVDEGKQEFQRRRDGLIKAKRKVDEEKLKLDLFLWEDDHLSSKKNYTAPLIPLPIKTYSADDLEQGKKRAANERPELQMVKLKTELNQIDLKVTENNLLPDLTLEAEPTRKPGEFVLGLGYRFGVRLSFPFYQKKARGEFLQQTGKAQQLKLLKKYKSKKVSLDVENAHNALKRAEERIRVSKEVLLLAKKLEKGERTRFKYGATSLLIVNLRERNVLKAEKEWITAMADYQKAQALYRFSIGEWSQKVSSSNGTNKKENFDL
ncbi:MAG: TolC family protein [Nitrospinae bacterium]|nr:TolC family protein [Nitrospinota bacterium]